MRSTRGAEAHSPVLRRRGREANRLSYFNFHVKNASS
jgi:hypothetical protein